MGAKYSTDVRFNHNMGLLETLSFQGEGVGAALYVAGFLTGHESLEILGIAFVLLAVAVLRAHLGQPTRGWRALTRVHSAWVSRGTLVISGFCALSVLAQAAAYVPFIRPFQHVLGIAALVVALPVIVYAGMLLRSMRAIRLWHTLNLPLSFSAHSVATALTFAAVLEPALRFSAIAALAAAAAFSAIHLLMIKPSPGTEASLNRLLKGDLRARVIGGAGAAGTGVPLLVLASSWTLSAASPGLVSAAIGVAALLRLYGDFAYRYSIVLAGAYEPVFPTAASSRPYVRPRAAA